MEVKHVDLSEFTSALNTTGAVTLLGTVAVGVSESQRIGRRLRWLDLQLKGTATSDSTTKLATGSFYVVYDKAPKGALPSVTDIFTAASSSAFPNWSNMERFNF